MTSYTRATYPNVKEAHAALTDHATRLGHVLTTCRKTYTVSEGGYVRVNEYQYFCSRCSEECFIVEHKHVTYATFEYVMATTMQTPCAHDCAYEPHPAD